MKAESKTDIPSCYHCGDLCSAGPVNFNDKQFCCRGCKTVYEIISENELAEYYEIENNPGIKEEAEVFTDFSFLDIPQIREEILAFSSAGIERLTFSIPGIHCSSCIWLLENLSKIKPSIIKSEVHFLNKEVSIQYKSEEISLRQVAELLKAIGYKPLIELDEKERARANKKKDLSYKYKLGIAGFAFGNTMLLSLPEYFSGGEYIDENFGFFFGFINLLLALPVFFYCSSSYFTSAWKGLKHKFLNIDVPISLGILALFIRSSYEVVSMTGAGYFDSMTGLVFFLLVGRWFQNRTYQALSFERDYKSYFPLGVTKIAKGEEVSTLLKDIGVGDEIIIHNGEIIPSDALLISGEANIDYSFVTGEAEPVSIETGEKLFAGGRQKGQQIHVKVEKEFSQSYLMQLWKQEEKVSYKGKDLSRMIDDVSQYFTAVILTVALVSGGYWWFVNPEIAFHTFSSVLIIACPCALALTIPFTYGNGMRLMEKAGMYLRDARFIEVFAAIDTVVFDKTGTITTQNNKTVDYWGEELSREDRSIVKSLTKSSAHPLSRMIHHKYHQSPEIDITDFSEIAGKGLKGEASGKEVLLGSSEFTGMTKEVTGTAVYLSIGGIEKGVFSIKNEYREGLMELVNNLKRRFRLEVITGDGEAEKDNLIRYFGSDTALKFHMDPFAKREHILKLREQGKKVMMIGDGLNDAGAIKSSHAGVSISDDIFGFLPSCDAIMEAEVFNKLSHILTFSRQMKKLVVLGFVISFLYNIIGLTFAVQGILSPVVAAILMPVSSISVVSFAIFSTNIASKRIKLFSFGKTDENHILN